ncbi:MAG: purine-binding chemotaxis protein CheW [Gemmatimonadaceae bacterium]|nr:purine-binding chemotaxis protein CheW [Gemmatimonadaceae bacterium]
MTQYATFKVQGMLFGVDVQRVQEVIRHQPMTPVPMADAVVRGLINLRGQIVTALDLRVRLDLGAYQAEATPMTVVVTTEDGPVALLVDEIGDVLSVDQDDWEPAPSTVQASVRELIPGAFKFAGQLMLQLDVDRVLELAAA